jgi:hypothetical protein
MRIVNRETFLSLPAGTIYTKWGDPEGSPDCLYHGEVSVKWDTCGNDFVRERLYNDIETTEEEFPFIDMMLQNAAVTGEPTPPMMIGEYAGRDGLFERKQMFAVYDAIEVDRLIAMLIKCRDAAYPPVTYDCVTGKPVDDAIIINLKSNYLATSQHYSHEEVAAWERGWYDGRVTGEDSMFITSPYDTDGADSLLYDAWQAGFDAA